MRGASRGDLEVGPVRRPRAGDERTPRARAAPGHRPGALRPPARSSLTAWVLREPWPEARPGCRKTPRWSAEWRARRSQDAPTPQGVRMLVAPLGAPFPSHVARAAKQTTAVPAPVKNTGDDAWLFDNLIGLRGERAAISFPCPLAGEGGECGASASRVRGQCLNSAPTPHPPRSLAFARH